MKNTLESTIGNTPLAKIKRLTDEGDGDIYLKLEGNNPAGSVKDRPAFFMINEAELSGKIKPGDTLIEATSGNTGIALAMVAAMRGYKMILIMPENQSIERRQTMKAFGAEIILTSQEGSMELARDTALNMQKDGRGIVLDQFGNTNNPKAHYEGTGPEIWRDTNKEITHFISSMGTTGTIVGTSKFLKEKNANIQIIGVQPEEGAQIPGIRKWPKEYLPSIFSGDNIDKIVNVTQKSAEDTARNLAKNEGIFSGASTGGALYVALQIAKQNPNSHIVSIACDRGDRYLSTGIFPE
ncbi:MAG: cysteine synthase CysM [Nitrosomonadales bacterium]|jgi:cysteine synthase B|nr:cysteine synthase CysM [Nitrosomonadales bacterium]MBT3917753.1 cysteine synthase CysM [Nitrosomonadales bacterium]MBT4758995.1 cysteine synthase CysM [Nitrosomonadales bacterium]MBT5150209.1 cysteine synthase CysM [Nitrosomonadales bacterium]MBT5573714.1 cysteine synthase CysM [Nitrosomonadales bacterium]